MNLLAAIILAGACPPSHWTTEQGAAFCGPALVKCEGKGAPPDQVFFTASYPGVDRPPVFEAAVVAIGTVWYADAVVDGIPRGPLCVFGSAWRGGVSCDVGGALHLQQECDE